MGGFALVALEGFIGGHKDRATAQRKRRVGNLIALQQAVELKRYIDGFVTLIRVALLPISYRTEWGKGGSKWVVVFGRSGCFLGWFADGCWAVLAKRQPASTMATSNKLIK